MHLLGFFALAAVCLASCSSPALTADTPDAATDASTPDVADAQSQDVVDARSQDVADAPPDAAARDAAVETGALAWRAVPSSTAANLRSVWGAADQVWIVGENDGRAGAVGTMLRGDARGMRAVALPDVASCQTYRCGLAHVWGRDAREVWAVGQGPGGGDTGVVVLRAEGDAWALQNAPHATYDGWLTGAYGPGGEVWIAGVYGSIARWSGRGWVGVNVSVSGLDPLAGTSNPYFRGQIAGLWHVEGGDVWAVGGSEGGGRAYITRWDGRAWRLEDTGRAPSLASIWGSGASDLWAVGMGGTILRWNGRAWTAVASGTTQSLHGVWGRAATDVWAVGDAGTVLHWDGLAWSTVTVDTTRPLRGVWGSGAEDVWVVGDGGAVLHYARGPALR